MKKKLFFLTKTKRHILFYVILKILLFYFKNLKYRIWLKCGGIYIIDGYLKILQPNIKIL